MEWYFIQALLLTGRPLMVLDSPSWLDSSPPISQLTAALAWKCSLEFPKCRILLCPWLQMPFIPDPTLFLGKFHLSLKIEMKDHFFQAAFTAPPFKWLIEMHLCSHSPVGTHQKLDTQYSNHCIITLCINTYSSEAGPLYSPFCILSPSLSG